MKYLLGHTVGVALIATPFLTTKLNAPLTGLMITLGGVVFVATSAFLLKAHKAHKDTQSTVGLGNVEYSSSTSRPIGVLAQKATVRRARGFITPNVTNEELLALCKGLKAEIYFDTKSDDVYFISDSTSEIMALFLKVSKIYPNLYPRDFSPIVNLVIEY